MKKIFLLIVLMLAINYAQGQERDPNALANEYINQLKNSKSFNLTIDKTYTVTDISLPILCKSENYKKICNFIGAYYSKNYEKDIVIERNSQIDFDNPNFQLNVKKAHQKVNVYFYNIPNDPVYKIFTLINKESYGDNPKLINDVNTLNIDKQSLKIISFNELFENPAIASDIAANKIKDHYKSNTGILFPALIGNLKVSPNNFLVSKSGLVFFFTADMVNTKEKGIEAYLIKLDEFTKAKPNLYYWSVLDDAQN